jgi:lipid-binding SYLF domain-containing protein
MFRRLKYCITRLASAALLILIPITATSGASSEQQRLVEEAKLTFERFLEKPGIASWYLAEGKNIKAVFIVPRLLRGAFVVGAAGGSGVLLLRTL